MEEKNENNIGNESNGKTITKKGLVITLKGLIVLIILFMLFISFMVVLISLLPGGRPASQSITNHEEFKNYSIEMITAENNVEGEVVKEEQSLVKIEGDISVDINGKEKRCYYVNVYPLFITSYKEFQKAAARYGYPENETKIYDEEFFKNNKLAVLMYKENYVGTRVTEYNYTGSIVKNNKISLYFDENLRDLESEDAIDSYDTYTITSEGPGSPRTHYTYPEELSTKACFISIDKSIKNAKFEVFVPRLKNVDMTGAFKPIIYIYPEKEKEVKVKLLNKDLITCSYPKYEDGWSVQAKPNGDFIDKQTGRNLYALYYESDLVKNAKVEDEGFSIKGEDTAKFLEEKLTMLGLTDREAEEFIVYWLPKLEANNYNYIRFLSKEEIEENMPLKITPNPDSVIRVWMSYKGLDKPIEVKNQIIETPVRTGFTVVEWGGTEIK